MAIAGINLGVAFLAGILSFLSPCILPLIPGYISFLSGVSLEQIKQRSSLEIKKTFYVSLLFVLGFSLIFLLLGASASFLGRFLLSQIKIFSKIAGAFIIFLGFYLLGIVKPEIFTRQKRIKLKFSPGYLSSFIAGMAFAFGWTPCFGPILAGILTLSATQETFWSGMFLLASYALGIGVPFILSGIFLGLFLRAFKRLEKVNKWAEKIAGLLLVLSGALIFSNQIQILLKFLPSWFHKLVK